MTTQRMIEQITARLPLLPPEVVRAVYALAVRPAQPDDGAVWGQAFGNDTASAADTQPYFVQAFGQEWDTAEEDNAWATL